MPSTDDLISRFKADYPQFTFKKSTQFLWSPDEKTIYFDDNSDEYPVYLIHELAHVVAVILLGLYFKITSDLAGNIWVVILDRKDDHAF